MKRELTLQKWFLLTSCCSIVFSIVLICTVSCLVLNRVTRKQASRTGDELVQQKKIEIETKIQGLERTIRDVIYNLELQRLLSEQDREKENSSYDKRIAVNHTISGALNSLSMLDNIAIFSQEGEMIGSMFEFDMIKRAEEYNWFPRVEDSSGETIWLEDDVSLVGDNYGTHIMIPGVKKIRSVYDYDQVRFGQRIGYVYFTLNLDSFLGGSQPDNGNQGRYVFVVSKNGQILGGNDRSRRGTYFSTDLLKEEKNHSYVEYDGGQYLLSYTETGTTSDWNIICLTEKKTILKDVYTTVFVCVALSLALLAVFGYVSVHNARYLSGPILRLEKEFEMAEQGNFAIPIHGKSNLVEIDSLFSRFHVMAYRLDKLITEVYEARIKEEKLIAAARQAQLQSLQMQINPHFLYNTLDSINWMALMEGNEEVSKMILALGHLFRNNMNMADIYTTAREEIENVRLYMYLEQVRFEGRLDYQVEAEEDVLELKVLKYMLQPLVENSIKYGIEPYHKKGTIRIRMKQKEGKLCVTVEDNGKGMEQDTLDALKDMWERTRKNQDMERSGASKQKGVGLYNIMQRLWLSWGEEAQFTIISGVGKGTRMEIEFPVKKVY